MEQEQTKQSILALVADSGIQIRAAHIALWQRIRLLQYKKGVCWALNSSLAEYFGWSKSYVSHLLTDLERVGCISRSIVYAHGTREVEARLIVAFDKPVQSDDEKIAVFAKIAKRTGEAGTRMRLAMNGRKCGLNPSKIWAAVEKFGTERVDQALAQVKASKSGLNPYIIFYGFLKNCWTLGKRASRYVGKVYEYEKKQRPAVLVGHGTIDMSKPMDPALRAMIDEVAAKRKAALATS